MLVREGTEDFLSEQKQWFQLNQSRLAVEYAAAASSRGEVVSTLENPFLTHLDQTKYDSVFTHQIFTPILAKALEASTKLGYPIQRPVVLANSPSIEPTPAVVPSTDRHMLFVGQGTYSFCNYWAKVFSAAIYRAGTVSMQDCSETSIINAIRNDPVMVKAVKLIFRYMCFGSLVGFGEFKQDQHLENFRILLVTSMETFVIGHELGHFFLHEKHSDLNGIPPNHTPHEVELLCDAIGYAICSAVGDAEENDVSRHLIGPLLLLYALKLSEDANCILLNLEPQTSATHPGLSTRIQSLFKFAKIADPSNTLSDAMEEALNYATIMGSYIKTVLISVQSEVGNES